MPLASADDDGELFADGESGGKGSSSSSDEVEFDFDDQPTPLPRETNVRLTTKTTIFPLIWLESASCALFIFPK